MALLVFTNIKINNCNSPNLWTGMKMTDLVYFPESCVGCTSYEVILHKNNLTKHILVTVDLYTKVIKRSCSYAT